jgi:hypothetical protein
LNPSDLPSCRALRPAQTPLQVFATIAQLQKPPSKWVVAAMNDRILWSSSFSASCLHAATCRAEGLPAADLEIAACIDPQSDALASEVASAGWPVDAALAQIASFAIDYGDNRELVERVAARLNLAPSDPAHLVRIAGAVADLEAALARARPDIGDELHVRQRPLREPWEARGPGMLRHIGRLTDSVVSPEAAGVVLVAPYVGGHGRAYPAQNRVLFEAMLYNPVAELPETVRLTWLLAQLNFDLPRLADALPPGRAAHVASLAMAPATLAAAEVVELATCKEAALGWALLAWRLVPPDDRATAGRLWTWWQTWLEGNAAWPAAVAALDCLLAPDADQRPARD